MIKAATKEEFWKTVKKGDILVWKGRHAVIFLCGTSIYHSHNSGVNQTNDLKSYWMGFGIPTIYRK